MNQIEYLFYSRAWPGERTNFINVDRARQFVKEHGSSGLILYIRGRGEKGRRTSCSAEIGDVKNVQDFDELLSSESFRIWSRVAREGKPIFSSCEADSYRGQHPRPLSKTQQKRRK